MNLTDNMKTAVRQLHGAARSAKEMGQDTRTLRALERAGLARAWHGRKPLRWSLTPAGVEVAQRI